MYEIATQRLPIKVWASALDDATLEQARHLADLPFAYHHVALMPDAHVGYGMPIGGVFAADGEVVPHAVGLDIGCGVRAWCTGLAIEEVLEKRDMVLSDAMRAIPAGSEWHRQAQDDETGLFERMPAVAASREQADRARRQLGSLGGGNHFLELQKDEDGVAWVMVHSGSRNVGKTMAEHYDRLAKADNERRGSPVPPEWGLAHLSLDSVEGREYLAVMTWCMAFSFENRRRMSGVVRESMLRRLKHMAPGEETDVHHNYASVETHFGKEVVVHRKGAVRAVGTVIVPGSMGTSTFVGRGLANPDSFESCAHGAGRAMGRGEAKRAIPVEKVVLGLRDAGVRLFKAHKSDVAEEAPEAYKDIDEVMRLQSDLVEPLRRLTPVGVFKG